MKELIARIEAEIEQTRADLAAAQDAQKRYSARHSELAKELGDLETGRMQERAAQRIDALTQRKLVEGVLHPHEAEELDRLEAQLARATPTIEQLRHATYRVSRESNRAGDLVQSCRTRLRALDDQLNGANLAHDHARELASLMKLLRKLADEGALALRAIPLPNGGELALTATRAGSHQPATVTLTVFGLDLTKPKENAA